MSRITNENILSTRHPGRDTIIIVVTFAAVIALCAVAAFFVMRRRRKLEEEIELMLWRVRSQDLDFMNTSGSSKGSKVSVYYTYICRVCCTPNMVKQQRQCIIYIFIRTRVQ